MEIFWSIARVEMRLMWRRRSYWVVHGLLTLPALAMIVASILAVLSESIEIGALVGGTGFGLLPLVLLPLFLLLIPLIAGPPYNQHWGKVGEILWSTPLDAFTHTAGLVCGVWLGMLPGIAVQFAAWILADLFLPDSLSDLAYLYALGVMLVTVTVALALCLLLAAVLRHTLLVLIAWVAGWFWLLLTLTPLESFVAIQRNSLYNIYFNTLLVSPALGLGAYQPLVQAMLVWFAGVSLAAACLSLLITLLLDRRRSVRRRRPAWLAAMIALPLLAGGLTANGRAVRSSDLPPSPYDIQQDVWQVRSQRLSAEVDPRSAEVAGTSTLVLEAVLDTDRAEHPPVSQVVLRLNAGLKVSQVQDGAGRPLAFRQYGDGLTIDLNAPPDGPVTLELAWQGRLHLPFDAYGQEWNAYGDLTGIRHFAPHPSGGLLVEGVGFLLRDGDWYPWPWSSQPHQAPDNRVSLRTSAPQALATVRLVDGSASWEGRLPGALLVFPPGRVERTGDVQLYPGRLAGSDLVQQYGRYAAAANRIWRLLGEKPLRHAVVLPYLTEILAGGDLLLLPEGSGHFLPNALQPLYYNAFNRAITEAQVERAAMAVVARAWLLERFPIQPRPFGAASAAADHNMFYLKPAGFSKATWKEQAGRWVQLPEIQDMETIYRPRAQNKLMPSGQLAAVGFWLALELASPQVREADLELLEFLAHDTQSGYSDRYRRMSSQLAPYFIEESAAQRIVWGLHQWAVAVGPERAVELAVQALQTSPDGEIESLFASLAQLSGVEVKESLP